MIAFRQFNLRTSALVFFHAQCYRNKLDMAKTYYTHTRMYYIDILSQLNLARSAVLTYTALSVRT